MRGTSRFAAGHTTSSYTGVVMPNRAGDWLAQAERDLEQARASQRDGRLQSTDAIDHASEILEFARSQMA